VSEAKLRAEGLRAVLHGAEILRGVDLEVSAGQVVGVIGPNGAGKSTLFRTLVGEIAAQAGRVWIGSREVTKLALWERARMGLGYVPQTPSVLFDLSVADNIRTFERIAHATPERLTERAARLHLEERLDVKASDLSGGERRRLELLRALIAQPKVLVCDEPLLGVDPALARRVLELLREHAQRGAAVLIADHRLGATLTVCDVALLLVDGRVELCAPPEEFSSHPAVVRRTLQ
jgi:lipopolysaccharide export system ATP-binding protein